MQEDLEEKILIFSDGSSRGNPGPGGWGAILVLRQNQNSQSKVVELGGREEHTTNNRMELLGAISALGFLNDLRLGTYDLRLYTDSSYLINGITKWVYGWQKNGWQTAQKKPVENQDLWQKLIDLVKNKKIDWQYVEGHAGHPANERCDEIATAFADNEKVKLFEGNLSDYKVDIFAEVKSFKKPKGLVYSYLSMVDGAIETHKTWAECEKRVKGKSGVKFKKVFSEEEEKKLIEEWSKQK